MFQLSALIPCTGCFSFGVCPRRQIGASHARVDDTLDTCVYGSSGYGRDVRSSHASDASDTEPSVVITMLLS